MKSGIQKRDELFRLKTFALPRSSFTHVDISVINLNSMLEIQYFQLCTSSISMFRIENDFLYFIPGDNPTQLKYYPIIRNNINNSILLGRLQTMKFQESISTFKTDSDLMVKFWIYGFSLTRLSLGYWFRKWYDQIHEKSFRNSNDSTSHQSSKINWCHS